MSSEISQVVNAAAMKGTAELSVGVRHLRVIKGDVVLPGGTAFSVYDTYGLPLDFIQDACHDVGVRLDLEGFEKARDEEQKPALGLRGKVRRSRRRILLISSFRNRSLRDTGRRGRMGVRCWPSFTTGRECGNSRPARRARSFSITRRFMLRLAGRWGTGDGFIRMITTPWSPR